MKVIDLIIKLQNLPPNMEVMVDVTPDESKAFHVTDAMGDNYVVISNQNLQSEQ